MTTCRGLGIVRSVKGRPVASVHRAEPPRPPTIYGEGAGGRRSKYQSQPQRS